MESYEVLKQAVSGVGVKSVAADMKLSSAMVYRWCEPNDSPDASGAKNPLDRVATLCDLTGDREPIKWLCRQVDGFFVQNTEADEEFSGAVFEATQKMLKEFSDVLQSVTDGMRNALGRLQHYVANKSVAHGHVRLPHEEVVPFDVALEIELGALQKLECLLCRLVPF